MTENPTTGTAAESGADTSNGEVEHEYAPCPECGAELNVLYKRWEFDPPMVTGWCPECRVAKSVPVKKEDDD